jgi:tetratricopeptide (TPR) repeat protein
MAEHARGAKTPFIILAALVLAAAGLAAMAVTAARAGEKEWLEVTDQAINYFQAGHRKEAIETARKALVMGEETFGPDSLKVVGSIDDLASYLKADGQVVEAEALYKRALSILEKRLPPDDRYLAIFMNYFANFYDNINKPKEAAALRARAGAIRSGKVKARQEAVVGEDKTVRTWEEAAGQEEKQSAGL